MQQLGQKFLQKYHCPVYPRYIMLPDTFSKNSYENVIGCACILLEAHLIRYIFYICI